jgi:hypothetical protein
MATSSSTGADSGAVATTFGISRKLLVVKSGAAATALGKNRLQLFVDALGVRLPLLPVAGGESPMLEGLKVAGYGK